MILGLLILGCSTKTKPSKATQSPFRQMKLAIAVGDWPAALQYVDAAIKAHPRSPMVLTTAAQVAHENNQPERSAEILAMACQADNFSEPKRVEQTVIALIGVGQFYTAIDLLEQAVDAQPSEHELRRMLYDFHVGTDNRLATLKHGRKIIRERRFDLPLLMTISNTKEREMEADPLDEMSNRNPDDKRPLLGSARYDFDAAKYEDAIRIIKTITESHPDFLAAQTLLARCYAATEDFDALDAWAKRQSKAIEAYPAYWMAIGDLARSKGQVNAMVQAYWEAARIDPDQIVSWQKLSVALRQLNDDSISSTTIAAVDERVKLLSRFDQLRSRFERSGSISRRFANEIALALEELGKLWEAEAWASIAMTLPEDDSVDVQATRQSIVGKLKADTPWQLTKNAPEFALDLTSLPTPLREGGASGDEMTSPMLATNTRNKTGLSGGANVTNPQDESSLFQLHDEASQRGIRFDGHTGDQLDQPGIMLYQTLGCGGATIDFDLDGWDDLYFVAAGGSPAAEDSAANSLTRNLSGQFVDVGELSRTDDRGFGQGVTVGDVNADGFADLLVLNYGLNALLINNGDGTFSRQSLSRGEDKHGWSTSAAIADLTDDGVADIVVTQYCAGLDPVTYRCGDEVIRSCSPMEFPALPDLFLEGDGQGQLVDRTKQWNAIPDELGRGLGVVVGAFDQQPGLDVIVANDMTNNHYWNRLGTDRPVELVESAVIRGLGGNDQASPQGSMGIATGDFDRDGDVDFYVTNFDNEYNIYHEQQSAGAWRDATTARRLVDSTLPLVGFGTEAVDLDNDGNLELVVSNGHVDMFSRGDEKSIYAHPMQIFSIDEKLAFLPARMEGDYLGKTHVGRALWTIDANRDGLTDLAVTHQTEPAALLVNHSSKEPHWVGFTLVGREC
ncbi:MAG: FG-GAP-like repeat-containing protein, partial [Pirellulaceae bacterium]